MFSKTCLNSLMIQKLWTKFKGHWELFIQFLIVFLELLSMLSLKLTKCLSILLLSLKKIIIPLLIKFMVLLDVCLLAFFSLLSLVEDKLIFLSFIILELKLSDSVLCHLCLNILSLMLACVSMFFENLTIYQIGKFIRENQLMTYIKSRILSSFGSW